MIFFELLRYGDFDMSYTESIWYKTNPTSQELEFHGDGVLLSSMLAEFHKLSGEMFLTEQGFSSLSIYCDKKEQQVLQAFKDYLRARGFRKVETTKVQFTDERKYTKEEIEKCLQK